MKCDGTRFERCYYMVQVYVWCFSWHDTSHKPHKVSVPVCLKSHKASCLISIHCDRAAPADPLNEPLRAQAAGGNIKQKLAEYMQIYEEHKKADMRIHGPLINDNGFGGRCVTPGHKREDRCRDFHKLLSGSVVCWREAWSCVCVICCHQGLEKAL